VKSLFPPCEPFPSDPLGIKLCETFPYLWKAILRSNESTGLWETLDKYPLRPRVLWRYWQDAAFIVGVRFGVETQYALIDIDAESDYHPNQSPHALANIRAALETIGICRTILTRSSHSGGLHLWLPLEGSVSSFWLATALKVCLGQHGFVVEQGQLETFPNCKSYSPQGQPTSEYQGHRLPLQPASGAALLDEDGQVQTGGLDTFFRQWDVAAAAQDGSLLTTNVALAREVQSKRRYRSTHTVVKEWREDLETELKDGWTGHGQTNHLLKTIACYGVVFAGQSEEGLVPYIVRTAIALPGYEEWCQHKAHIEQRAKDWAKAADGYYWALGTEGCRTSVFHQRDASNSIVRINRNQARAAEAQQRIQQAVEVLEADHALPSAIGQRMDAIVSLAHCSRQTLRKVLPLWHPQHRQERASNGCVEALLAVIEPERVALKPACTDDQEGDRGFAADSAPDLPKPPNAHEKDFVHTHAQQMKRGLAVEVSSRKASQTTPLAANRFANVESVTVAATNVVAETTDGRMSDAFPQMSSVTTLPIETGTPVTSNGHLPQGKRTQTPSRLIAHRETDRPTLPTPPATTLINTSQGTTAGTQELTVVKTAKTELTTPPETPRKTRQRRSIPLAEQALPPYAILLAPEPVYPDIAPDEVRRVTEAIGGILQKLQQQCDWTAKHLALWLSEHFAGRRRSQIPDRELPTLLERLQHHYESILAAVDTPTGQTETLLQEPPPPD